LPDQKEGIRRKTAAKTENIETDNISCKNANVFLPDMILALTENIQPCRKSLLGYFVNFSIQLFPSEILFNLFAPKFAPKFAPNIFYFYYLCAFFT
jgi:hypothetical protein